MATEGMNLAPRSRFGGTSVNQSPWAAIIWLVVSTVLLVPITRWFGHHIQGLALLLTRNPTAALYLHFFLLLPGTLIHELSHLATAKLLGVKTGKLSLQPKAKRGGVSQFGAVRLERSDIVRESLIGLAPLLTGSTLILLLAHWRFDLDPHLALAVEELPAQIGQILRSQDAWLWIYLIMAISNAMLPSEPDRRAWRPLATCLAAIMAGLYLTGTLAQMPSQVVAWVLRLASYLAFAFTLTILLDLVIGALLWGLEIVIGLALNRRVQYG